MGLFNSIRLGASGAGDYEVKRSLRFHNSDNTRIQRAIGSTSNRRTFTYSFWLKRTVNSAEQYFFYNGPASGTPYFDARFEQDSHELQIADYTPGESTTRPIRFITNRKFRDPSAWYHFVVAVDTTQGTESNRFKLYVNGVQETSFSTAVYPSQNYDSSVNVSGHIQGWGTNQEGTSGDYDGYLAEAHFIDGLQLTPSSFAETDAITGEWKPKKYAGAYGTNGNYLNFSDNSGTTATTLGKDYSGNGNNFTPHNFSVSAGEGNDSLEDSPTNNFCTLNPLDKGVTDASHLVYSNGNLQVKAASGVWASTRGTFAVSSGKWYWEIKLLSVASMRPFIGIIESEVRLASNQGDTTHELGAASTSISYWIGSPIVRGGANTSGTNTNVPSCTTGDIVGVALDMDNKKVFFSKNGTFFASQDPANSSGELVAFSTTMQSSAIAPAIQAYNDTDEGAFNFGQRAFSHTPPTGYKTLCSANLPDPTIAEGNKHFNALIYTGNDSSDRDITGVGFQPDFLWIKNRQQADWHQLCDAVRGANKVLFSNTNDGEDTDNSNGHVNSFLADGFNVDAGSGGNVNENNENYVAWNWNAGGSTVTNNDGSRTAQVRANTTAGFSIVTSTSGGSSGGTYDSFGHGLGVAPNVIIFKNRDISDNWSIYNSNFSTAYSKILQFNTIVETTSSNHWGTANPTSTTFSLNQGAVFTGASQNLVAYCFSEVAGYSKFGSYIGNNNADGTFVYLGFRPAWVMIKNTEAGSTAWYMLDNKRDPDNPAQEYLAAEDAGGEGTYVFYDFLSNGFKLRNTGPAQNPNGQKVIYMAFAESPFKYARAR